MRWGVVSSSELGDDWSAEAHLPPTSPLAVECPACQAPPGHRCTAPTVSGRAYVEWFHSARKDLSEGWT